MNSCLICKQIPVENLAPFLCVKCGILLEPAQEDPNFQSLYRYNKVLRNLILKVKIQGNYRSLACLEYLFLNSPVSTELAKTSDLIIPAPSSLWSRLRGRIDLAWLLGSSLAKHHNLKTRQAPWSLHWQLSKRSKMAEREKMEGDKTTRKDDKERIVLIIDDVVTSGHTLRRTASALKEEHCRFLTLASALH